MVLNTFDRRRIRFEYLIFRIGELGDVGEDQSKLLQLLNEGKRVVRKCYKISKWNVIRRCRYSQKLHKLEKELHGLAGKDTELEMHDDIVNVLNGMKEMRQKLDQLTVGKVLVAGVNDASCAIPELPTLTVGLDLPVEDLKSILFHDGGSLIGICGPAGCGKTTLLAKLCSDDAVKARFKDIIFLSISVSPNILETARRLWARLVDASNMPSFVSDVDAVEQLRENLKMRIKDSYLVVYDDVWSDLVLEKLVFRDVDIKTIVTSRIKFKRFDTTYSLKGLEKSDAMTLFRHYASFEDQAADKPVYQSVEQIVDGCGGLPLVLKVIGNSLKQQPAKKWRRTSLMLKEGIQIFDFHKDLLDCLATNITSLSKELCECFLDFVSFPDNKKIPATSLIDIWVETRGLSEEESLDTLLELSRRNLITLLDRRYEAVDPNEGIRDLYVLQDALMRRLAIFFIQKNDANKDKRLVMSRREDGLPRSWNRLKDQTSQAKLVSIHTGEMSASSWLNISFPKAEVLIIYFSSRTYCLPPFLEKMDNLKVLIISNYYANTAELNNGPSPRLPKHLRRLRLEKLFIPYLSTAVLPCPNLEKLTMVSCDVHPTDEYLSLDVSTILDSLKELEIDDCNNLVQLPIGLCSIIPLQKLSIRNCPDLVQLPHAIGKLKYLEVLSLQACRGLRGLPDSICDLESLKFLDLSLCSSIELLPGEFGKLHRLERYDMRRCLQLRQLPKSIQMMDGLRKVVCDEDAAVLWEPFASLLGNLHLSVDKEFVNSDWLV